MPLEFEQYLQPCSVSNFYATMASADSMKLHDSDAVISNHEYQLPLMNGVVHKSQLSSMNGVASDRSQLSSINSLAAPLSSPRRNAFKNSDAQSNDATSTAGSRNLARFLKQRKIGQSKQNFDGSQLHTYGYRANSDTTSIGHVTSTYSRPLTPALRQHSLPARLFARSETDVADSTPRRRHHSVKFADELGKLLSTFVVIPSRYDDDERTSGLQLLDDSDDSDIESCFKSKTVADTNPFPGRNGLTRMRRCSDLIQQTLPFRLCFEQPVTNYDRFLASLQSLSVSLEKVKLELVDCREKSSGDRPGNNGYTGLALRETVHCTVRVANIDLHKRVFARCTSDDWKTSADIDATYIDPGTGGFSVSYDTFTFSIVRPPGSGSCVSPSGRPGEAAGRTGGVVEFSICYEVKGLSYWDNNDGGNYRIVWL